MPILNADELLQFAQQKFEHAVAEWEANGYRLNRRSIRCYGEALAYTEMYKRITEGDIYYSLVIEEQWRDSEFGQHYRKARIQEVANDKR